MRKSGTPWFMQAGGKIERGEAPRDALRRELWQEIGVSLDESEVRYLGLFSAPAANEPDHRVEAEIFHLRLGRHPLPGAEIAETIWVGCAQAEAMPLAPLTRNHMLPLARALQRQDRH